MGRSTPCCEKTGLNKGKWTAEEDEKLISYIKANGDGSWRSVPKNAGLLRCGKSCRLRWMNYLRGDVKRGKFSEEEEETIVKMHKTFGNNRLPGRTDNERKNSWNTQLSPRIYQYRSIGAIAEADLTKITTGTYKKRAAPKKSSAKNANSPDIIAAPTTDVDREHAESNNRIAGWEFFASTNEVTEGYDFGQWGTGIDGDILMHVERFLEGEEEEEEEMGMKEKVCGEWGININIENMGVHSSSSPTTQYCNFEDQLGCDHVHGGGEELHLWNFGEEGDHMMIWW